VYCRGLRPRLVAEGHVTRKIETDGIVTTTHTI
jgi:hypothetical protein